MPADASLTARLAALGYTHREPSLDERREHRAGVYGRAVCDATGRCVAVLSASGCEAWLAEREVRDGW